VAAARQQMLQCSTATDCQRSDSDRVCGSTVNKLEQKQRLDDWLMNLLLFSSCGWVWGKKLSDAALSSNRMF